MLAVLQNPIFQDETAAREWLEARVWPNGPVCPHCSVTADHVTKLEGKKHRPGVYQCNECREQFTVTVTTVFERSKLPLTKWLAALFLMTASKKGVSAHQIHRMLKISYKSSWFMCHRLREAMRPDSMSPLGGNGGVVESDETYFGKPAQAPKGRHGGKGYKNGILTLVERGGSARSFHIDGQAISDIMPIIHENIAREATVMTDEARHYNDVAGAFAGHKTVKHSDEEYARAEFWIDEDNKLHAETISTNTVEGYYSIFKRGMKGIYQHCSEKHLHRYLAEFDFRYSYRVKIGYSDTDRASVLANGIKGKRLTYRRPNSASFAKAT